MTPLDVQARIEAISVAVAKENDPEKASALERELWRDVFTAISEGCDRPRTLAAHALATTALRFRRCA